MTRILREEADILVVESVARMGAGSQGLYGGTQNVKWFGATGDGQRVSDATISLNANLVHSATAKFVAADVGKLCSFYNAALAGGTLVGKITQLIGPHDVAISVNAQVGVATNGVFRWGTDNYAAILTALNAAIVVPPNLITTYALATTLFFPPGEYMVSQTIVLSSNYNGIVLRGGNPGKAGPVPSGATKITFMGASGPLLKNTCQGCYFYNLWFDGGRLATRTVDFEYFAVQQSWYDCLFDAPAPSGVVHYYGVDNGPLEIDNTQFHNCFLYGDFFDATYRPAAIIKNVNGNAFQIDYYNGLLQNANYILDLSQGSVNLHGTQVQNWGTAMCHINGTVAFMELEDIYNEGSSGPFLVAVYNGSIASDDCVVLRRCHITSVNNTPIQWKHQQPLVLEDTEIVSTVDSDPDACIQPGTNIPYGIKPIVPRNLRFVQVFGTAGFTFSSGVPWRLIDGNWYSTSASRPQVTDGQINASSNVFNSASAAFTQQSVGLQLTIPGAGAAGAALTAWVKQFVSATQVILSETATTGVSGATVTFAPLPFSGTKSNATSDLVSTTGYDANNLMLAIGSYIVPGDLATTVIAADCHDVAALTADRTYNLSQNGVGQVGAKMRISRVGAADAFAANVVYNQASPTTVQLFSNDWADFEYIPNSGWILIASGTAGTVLNPLNLPGLQILFDASNQATPGTWTDLSSNANNATQGVGGNQPSKIASSVLGNQLAMRFNGTSSQMNTGALVTVGGAGIPGSVCAVVVPQALTGVQSVFSANGFRLLTAINGQWAYYTAQTGNGQVSALTIGNPFCLIATQISNANTPTWTNGAQVTLSSTVVGAGDNPCTIGANGSGANNQFGQIDLALLVVSNVAWTGAQVGQLRSYVSKRFGFSA